MFTDNLNFHYTDNWSTYIVCDTQVDYPVVRHVVEQITAKIHITHMSVKVKKEKHGRLSV